MPPCHGTGWFVAPSWKSVHILGAPKKDPLNPLESPKWHWLFLHPIGENDNTSRSNLLCSIFPQKIHICVWIVYFFNQKFLHLKKHTHPNCKNAMYLIRMSFCWYKNKLAKIEADRVLLHTARNKFENMPTIN